RTDLRHRVRFACGLVFRCVFRCIINQIGNNKPSVKRTREEEEGSACL
uniref:Uncharacterized protein n=1 Tax=Anopheles quadriannulatus TaxID=34691 RepID=A0A182XSX4_ANOQN